MKLLKLFTILIAALAMTTTPALAKGKRGGKSYKSSSSSSYSGRTGGGRGNKPCSGNKGGVKACTTNGKFLCNDGTISKSKRVCK